MSHLVGLRPEFETIEPAHNLVASHSATSLLSQAGTHSAFAQAQIRSLVRQVFRADASRLRVVFSPVDDDTDISSLCLAVGQTLSQEKSGTVCVVRNCVDGQPQSQPSHSQKKFGILRDAGLQLSPQLWLFPQSHLFEERGPHPLAALRGRLSELELEFDYTLIQAQAVTSSSDAALLGNLCDGVILVIQANSTRRVAAAKAKRILETADARLLGVVLADRTFPIPESIYKRL